jgi:hypothetical protein
MGASSQSTATREWADYRKYVRMFGAHMSIREFAQLYWERAEGSNIKIPKAMDAAFSVPQTDDERRIREAIDRFNGERATRLEQELQAARATRRRGTRPAKQDDEGGH